MKRLRTYPFSNPALLIKSALFALFTVVFWSCSQQISREDIRHHFITDLQQLMLEYTDDSDLPGMGFAYYSDSVGMITLAVGAADIERNSPLDITTHYPIQSTTKMFLSILSLQLIEEGKLTLGSTIDQWVDGVPNKGHITINHLLQQTSGLNRYQANAEFIEEYYTNNERKYSRDDLIHAGLAIPYNNEDFGSFKYSNTNFLLLANIIESITHQTIGQALKKRIFLPANMKNTYYKPEIENDKHEIVKCYENGYPLDLDKVNFMSNAAGGLTSSPP